MDDRLVHRLAPNLYRTLNEAVSAMDYISSAGNFNFFERITAKYYGAVAMYFLSKRLKKKYVYISHTCSTSPGSLFTGK